MERLEAAAAAVREHDAQREELADAIVEALTAGWRPSQVEAKVPYDRNHVRKIAKDRGVPGRRPPTVGPLKKS